VFILCNPHNPVSKVFQKDELERMAEICLQNEVVICSDEIHCDFIFKGYRHYPIAAIDPEIAQNTITLMAPSKTFNIAGLQCSFAIIQNGELREQFLGAQKGLVPWVNMMGMLAGEVAYREGGEWLEQLMVYLEANRDFLTNYIEAEMSEIQVRKVEGTYLAWLDCRQLEINTSPCEFFIQKGRVAFNDGATFGSGGEGFVRFNFGCPRSMLEEALQRMNLAIKS
jgi:cystathionine beta-lyase